MKSKFLSPLFGLLTVFLLLLGGCQQKAANNSESAKKTNEPLQIESVYTVSEEEKAARQAQFKSLKAVNSEAIAYIYAPGTKLDEPVVQTGDNATYLEKTFEGGQEPYMGTVFMDMDNSSDFQDKLTWLFGHARGSTVPDHRMFNDVNFYDDQAFFDEHPYVVVQTPERTYYYEAAFLIIVPETTAYYRTEFDSDEQFAQQLTEVSEQAHTKNANIKISESDKYLVLSTCREDDETIRSNLYLRQIPDSELTEFLAENEGKLAYTPTR